MPEPVLPLADNVILPDDAVEFLNTSDPVLELVFPRVRAPAERLRFALVKVRALLEPILHVEAALPVRLRAWPEALTTLESPAVVKVRD